MLTQDEAIAAARSAVEGTFTDEELDRVDARLIGGSYIVKFILKVPPQSLGSGFVQVTLDAQSGEIIERLRDAD